MAQTKSSGRTPEASSTLRAVDFSDILENYKKGSSRQYDKFLSQLASAHVEPSALVSHLRGLRDCITLLDKDHEILVGLLLKLDWVSQDHQVVVEFQSFLLNLISAHTYYLRAGLRMLVKHFLTKKISEPTEVTDKKKEEASFMNVHLVLRAVAQIVPVTPTILMPLLYSSFPFINKSTHCYECYCKNILRIVQYIPQLRLQLLELICDQMMKLDVRSPRKMIEEAEENAEKDMDQDVLFEMDESRLHLESDNPSDLSKSEEIKPMAHNLADKLDVMMDLMMKFINASCYSNGELDWEATKKLYRELLLVFEKIILQTHASCHVQFIMFYICSYKQPICDGFVDYLWKKVQDPNTQPVFRQASVGYIGSLLARALYIPVSTVKTCLSLMASWVHAYLDQACLDNHRPDVGHHGPFYSVCQAIFYVFCFRSKEIFEMKKGYKWAEGLNFQRIVTSRLNPLRVCLPIVVKTFASLTRMHQLAFCDTVIERNKRCQIPLSSNDQHGQSAEAQFSILDSFFPFDPYLLHRSAKFILPLYREYQGNLADEEKHDSEDEDDFLVEDQATPGATDILTSPVFSQGKASTDFLHYGVSPGFKTT